MEILLIPPTIIARARKVRVIPLIHVGTRNVLKSASEIEFAWVKFPIPKDATTANRAKSQPNISPALLFLKAFFMVYMGPPDISPFSFTSLYLIASIHSLNFEVKPNAAEIHIHTNAPGPPETIAVATPTILPVPMVAARAVVRAEKGEISPVPFPFVLASLLKVSLRAYPRFLQEANPSRNVRKIPVPTKSTSITGPHTKSSTLLIISANFSIFSPFLPLYFK